MKSIISFFEKWAESAERRECERRETYLVRSADIDDLEYRLRELDREAGPAPSWMGWLTVERSRK
jgi:hypothetical protein